MDDEKNTESQATGGKKFSVYERIFIPLFIVFAIIALIDFIVIDQKLYHLTRAVGFGLFAYGAYKNHPLAGGAGAVFVIGSLVAKYVLG
ncbi:hypothetical protein QLX67_13205 [Balneolaceae bacterium ANBcel3]|nr:hypothetical protein [Balneolaceae bacterium ANBcel3]